MLLLIVEKVLEEIERGGFNKVGSTAPPSPLSEFNDDLWSTIWEVSNTVLKDMEKERKKEMIKQYVQSPEVMEMCRFTGEIEDAKEEGEGSIASDETQSQSISLPKRKGKLKYKIYVLDFSNPKWIEIVDKIHEVKEEADWVKAKPVTGKSKLVMEKIKSLKEGDDPSGVLAEWVELLEPQRVAASTETCLICRRIYGRRSEAFPDSASYMSLYQIHLPRLLPLPRLLSCLRSFVLDVVFASSDFFVVKKYVHEHTCDETERTPNNKQVTVKLIGSLIRNNFGELNDGVNPEHITKQVRREHGVTYTKARRAKELAKKLNLEGPDFETELLCVPLAIDTSGEENEIGWRVW
ncbi:unnamed protein product [Cochlearia groenlandica]